MLLMKNDTEEEEEERQAGTDGWTAGGREGELID
jgi:hypothetical protein